MIKKENLIQYLNEHNVMTIATIDALGPWACALFFVNNDLTFYFLSSPDSRHVRAFKLNSKVAATIQKEYSSSEWRNIQGIQLEGDVFPISGEEELIARKLYQTKFPIIDNATASIAKAMSKIAWYKIVPKHIYFINNSQSLGHREEIIWDQLQ